MANELGPFRARLSAAAAVLGIVLTAASCSSGAAPQPGATLPAVAGKGLTGLLLPAGQVPSGLVADANYGISSGSAYAKAAEAGAKHVGCSAGAGLAYTDPGFVKGDGADEPASTHDVFLESVLQCTAAKASSVYQNYVKNLPSDIQKSKVAGLGQSAVAAYIPAVGQNPASDAVIWVEGPYLFYLDYIGNSKSFSPGWLSGRAQALKTQDFVA